jgi:hypothetical protein
LRAALASHQSSGGVFFDSRAWLITARRPSHAHWGTGMKYTHATTAQWPKQAARRDR